MENDFDFFNFLNSCSNEYSTPFTVIEDLESSIVVDSKDCSFKQEQKEKREISRVRYGKSYLNKNSEDYKKWRERNNQSIQNCRKKKKSFEIEKKNKLIELKNENNKMIERQLGIIRELGFFKVLFSNFEQINFEDIDKLHEKLLILKKESF